MNQPLAFSILAGSLGALAPAALHAQEVARVVSSVPVIQQVAVPRQVCSASPVLVEQPRSGAGALMGAIAGAALGNAIGDGSGRAAATLLGVIGGAAVGDRVEGPNRHLQQATHCSTQTYYENRAVGYNVTYEFSGKHYTVQMPHDPGPTLPVQVVPVGVDPAPPAPTAAVQPSYVQPVAPTTWAPSPSVSAPIPVIREYVLVPAPVSYAPAYSAWPAPSRRAFAPNVSLHLGYVHGGHHRHSHHRH